MKGLGRRFLIIGAVAAGAAWGTMFCLYGAYRGRAESEQLSKMAEGSAEVLARALGAVEDEGRPRALRALADPARGGALRAAALIGDDGALLAAFPGGGPNRDPSTAVGCATCHQPGAAAPEVGPISDDGLVHVFLPRAVAGSHLYLAFDEAFLGRGRADLAVAFGSGLAAVAAVLIVLWLTLRAWVLVPAQQLVTEMAAMGKTVSGDDMDELVATLRHESAACVEVEGILGRCVARWKMAEETSLGHLEDLKHGAHTTREIGRLILDSARQLSTTVEEFREHLNGISNSTSDNSTSLIQMSASVDEVAGSSDQLSQYVLNTAGSVEQMVKAIGEVADRVEILARETDTTAASMANIDSSTREIETNARQATLLGGRMAEAAREGARAVEETLRGIHFSYGVIQETARAMDELQESFLAIGSVVKIINEINDKTKLLALNAAIIAAQAGEHGKSFAVVAHEIKNLSDRTSSSTGQISQLIKSIRGRMSAAAEAVSRGEGATGSSVELAERAGEALQHIRDTAQVSHEMTREILLATEAQSRGSQKVMASMQEVNAMVSYIRQAAGEHRTSGESVVAQTGDMRELTEQVKLATAEQAEASRYISDAIAAIDCNLQTMVDAVDSKRKDTALIVNQATELLERGEAEALELQAVEDSLAGVSVELDTLREALGLELIGPGQADG